MKKLSVFLCFSLITRLTYSQLVNSIVNTADVQRIENTLSADDMQGRKAFTPAAERAADFISSEFQKIGLKPLKEATGFKQFFNMVRTKLVSISASFNAEPVNTKDIVVFSCLPELTVTGNSGFKIVSIGAKSNFIKEVTEYARLKENIVVFVDKSFSKYFSYLPQMNQYLFKSDKTVLFVLGINNWENFNVSATQQVEEIQSANVAGVLPGKSKPEELVVFSGHYDHLGIEKSGGSDSIYNGANDDASGITAIIEIAKYFKEANNNERSLVFVAFTAEELGGFGSQYFSRQVDAEKVVAMFNIEMIGTESKWGKNSAYITGYERSDLGKILQSNLDGSGFAFYPDPYPEQNLFFRSDNATLAMLGVPAHTISTSKMDSEPNYHKLSDEISTLNIANMTAIIKAVVASSKSIVSGKDTPSRVKPENF